MYIPVEFTSKLKPRDKEVLGSFFLMRCLDEGLLHQMFYALDGRSMDYVKRRIRWFVKNDIVERVNYGEAKPALFLTTKGVGLVRHYLKIPNEAFLKVRRKTFLGLYTAGDLKLDTKLINHQLHLNRFVAEFKNRAHTIDLDWQYLDEKYVSRYQVVRPDGIIQVGQEDLFLEMDMGTESSQQLAKKWRNYRIFVRSDWFVQRERSIKVIFIVGNVKNPSLKTRRIKSLIAEHLMDIVSSDFDFFIADSQTLIETVFDRILSAGRFHQHIVPETHNLLSRGHGFLVSCGSRLSTLLEGYTFDLYLRKLTEKQQILSVEGTPQEYLVDFYLGRPLSVLKKIAYIRKINGLYLAKLHRPIKYIVIVEEEKTMLEDLKTLNLSPPDNVYFTTLNRLVNMQFFEALYQYDTLDSVVHFTDGSLSGRIYERSL